MILDEDNVKTPEFMNLIQETHPRHIAQDFGAQYTPQCTLPLRIWREEFNFWFYFKRKIKA